MSYFVIIRGAAGVGKSTVSKLLANRLGAEVIHFDKIMKELGLDYILGDKWIPLDKFLLADKRKIPGFKEKLKAGIVLIIEGNFYHQEQVDDLIEHLDFPSHVFTLKASLDECIKRDKTRDNALMDKSTSDVFELVSAFNYGFDINTNNKTPKDIVKEICSYFD